MVQGGWTSLSANKHGDVVVAGENGEGRLSVDENGARFFVQGGDGKSEARLSIDEHGGVVSISNKAKQNVGECYLRGWWRVEPPIRMGMKRAVCRTNASLLAIVNFLELLTDPKIVQTLGSKSHYRLRGRFPRRKGMRRFGTEGRLYLEDNYIVPRTEETADFIDRVKQGKYIVLFAPRQTGKTTFFRLALDTLTTADPTYFPIQLNFEEYENSVPADFYRCFYNDIREEIEEVLQRQEEGPPEVLLHFLDNVEINDHISMRRFFSKLASFLKNQKVVLLIDEFDAIPRDAVTGFLRSLRRIYLSGRTRCPHSVGIVGIKNIIQLNYDRSVSPFNIQQEFHLPNFTLEQVQELLGQYTDEVGQAFVPDVVTAIHKQTAGQPVLVNRFAQILTEELDIPKTEPITMEHWTTAHAQLLHARNTNIQHLTTNIRKDPRFEKILMRITAHEDGVPFNIDDDNISELASYGVISRGTDGMCEIANPIYLYRILRAFKPAVNGLEEEYFPSRKTESISTR